MRATSVRARDRLGHTVRGIKFKAVLALMRRADPDFNTRPNKDACLLLASAMAIRSMDSESLSRYTHIPKARSRILVKNARRSKLFGSRKVNHGFWDEGGFGFFADAERMG